MTRHPNEWDPLDPPYRSHDGHALADITDISISMAMARAYLFLPWLRRGQLARRGRQTKRTLDE